MVRGAEHPQLFWGKHASSPIFDAIKLLGAVPVTAKNLFKLFAAKSRVLLYPGSEREAVHNKGEEYKLFWLTDPPMLSDHLKDSSRGTVRTRNVFDRIVRRMTYSAMSSAIHEVPTFKP
ncbi:hypothetical protein D8674_007580 [Pyrus ussuriensis x Pyrus communis]|uniref:Uncharacterized protein n=1 Tax=Pyrus ussuriensis x Pyrus communis TaxID=2448454 RepID=A0A5N5HV06_9ROSA|nr:hypothetical protein D8674_007580 [Pyrus ussuriensis x Pyrus communis]